MNKQDLIKLAEVADFQWSEYRKGDEDEDVYIRSLEGYTLWQPHENIAQAFEVLEGFSGVWGLCGDSQEYECELFPKDPIKTDKGNRFYSMKSDSLPVAICYAVLKATRSKGE